MVQTRSLKSDQAAKWDRGCLFSVAIAAGVGFLVFASREMGARSLWLGLLGLLAALTVGAGLVATGRWLGFLIDARNRASLSRLQFALWALFLTSAYAAAVWRNLLVNALRPTEVEISVGALSVLAISMASLITSSVVLVIKARKRPDIAELERTLAQFGERRDRVDEPYDSLVLRYRQPADARWIDVVRGDESGNAAHTDLFKIQFVFFSSLVLGLYAMVLIDWFDQTGRFEVLPGVTGNLIVLLGISHAVYLAGKLVPRSRASTASAEERPRSVARDEPAPEATYEPVAPAHPPQELMAAVAASRCVLFAGGGLARQAGLPTWPGLLTGLATHAAEEGQIDGATAEIYRRGLGKERDDEVATELMHRLDRDFVLRYLDSLYARQSPSGVHHSLSQVPFSGVINASFDDLIDRSFDWRRPARMDPIDKAGLVQGISGQSFFILPLYGSFGGRNLLLTARAYREAIERNPTLERFLRSTFTSSTVLFLGCSLEGIRDVVESLRIGSGPSDRRHFALVGEREPLSELKVRHLAREYGIEVLSFRPREGFPEVREFVDALRLHPDVRRDLERVRASLKQDRGTLTREKPPPIDHVELRNIGPFDRLELDFTPGWNVLLGDNGLGKTIILRSIAAALGGEELAASEHRQWVGRLLSTSARKGRITVVCGRRTMTVELERGEDGLVDVASSGAPSLLFGSRLVLAFSALRAVSWERPSVSTDPEADRAKRRRPALADLVPVLSGQPDTRMSDIKQWLVDLDYERTANPRAQKLWRRFFEVLDAVTVDLPFGEPRVDRSTRAIALETEFGEVPLEAVSQGTASVLCWVGTLLHRLHDVHVELAEPEAGGANVLVDEIDAHMHPTWQRRLPELLLNQGTEVESLFPEVQFIATTHSPLIVGSLAPEEVHVVRRVPLVAEVAGELRVRELDGGNQLEVWVEPDEPDAATAEDEWPRRYRVHRSARLLVEEGEPVMAGDRLTERPARIEVTPLETDLRGWSADQILTGPPFELATPYSPSQERLESRYATLLNQRGPDDPEVRELEDQIEESSPGEGRTEIDRQAWQALEDFTRERFANLPEDKRAHLVASLRGLVSG